VEILPRKLEGRIRGLQTHKQKEEKAQPGSRTAVNITGISVDQVQRGDVVVHPETYQATNMMDVWCTLLKDADAPLNHNTEVKLFLGAAEVMARVRLLGVQQLEPGGEAFLQLMLKEPVVALRQDRFIIRRPSPAATIGGGQVIDPHPQHRHKRFNSNRIEELESLLVGTPQEILLQTAQKLGAASAQYLIKGSGLEAKEADEALKLLVDKGVIQELKGKKILITSTLQQQFTDKILMKITAYHRRFPLRLGMPREQLKSETNLNADVFDALVLQLTDSGKLAAFDAKLRLMEHAIAFTDKQQGQVENLLKQFDGQPYSPPSVKQSLAEIGEELLNALIETGQLIQISEDVLFRSGAYLEMREAVIEHIRDHGEISLAELRDKFDTSRKYAVALLEYLDQTGVTIRKGDNRILRRRS
jgi:selenocysteine-specific elongation factor